MTAHHVNLTLKDLWRAGISKSRASGLRRQTGTETPRRRPEFSAGGMNPNRKRQSMFDQTPTVSPRVAEAHAADLGDQLVQGVVAKMRADKEAADKTAAAVEARTPGAAHQEPRQ